MLMRYTHLRAEDLVKKLSESVYSHGWIVDKVIYGTQSQYAGIRVSTTCATEPIGASITVGAFTAGTSIDQTPISISDRRTSGTPGSGCQYDELAVSFGNRLPDRSGRR